MTGKTRASRRQLFPEKLWDLVNKPDSGVTWTQDGKKIEVERTQLEKLIGTKFRSKNFDSFIRQLHFYGFRKSGNYYQHDKFQRGQPEALKTMKRKYSNQAHLLVSSPSQSQSNQQQQPNNTSNSSSINPSYSPVDQSASYEESCYAKVANDLADHNLQQQQQCVPIDYSYTGSRRKITQLSPYKSPIKSVSRRQTALLFFIE